MRGIAGLLAAAVRTVTHMTPRWSNAFYEKNMTDFLCECIPMMIFMPRGSDTEG